MSVAGPAPRPGEPHARSAPAADGHGSLGIRRAPDRPAAAVLLLHGGRADALGPPPALNLPAARMRPLASGLVRATLLDRVLVGHVRYRHRGWNGRREDPVRDARDALAAVAELAGPVPVVLVGHSMGARAALRIAAEPQVRGIVALAPWCPPAEPVGQLAGRRVVALHDPQDRVTSAGGTWSHLARAQEVGARTLGVAMPGGGHAMLRGYRTWHRLATALTLGLLGLAPLPAALTGPPGPAAPPVPAGRVLDEIG
ncbi:alpha/beta hydrolase [Streptomyces subrutilus]|uniref:alpha/beta hydrolase n=1 Tax=Streptomyces subrutilus TaxID=36818 RepID=UPI002E13ED49|nr:alpha/beta fold hydrolase [Streptomyces subrutilus]